MPEPYIQVFNIRFENEIKQFSSVVLDKVEFDQLVDTTELSKKDKKLLKHNNHVPGIVRGTKTEWVFKKFGLQTQYASFIVRGCGEQVLSKLQTQLELDTMKN